MMYPTTAILRKTGPRQQPFWVVVYWLCAVLAGWLASGLVCCDVSCLVHSSLVLVSESGPGNLMHGLLVLPSALLGLGVKSVGL